MLGYSIRSPDSSHHRQLVPIESARKLGADHFPTITSIVAAIQSVGREIKPGVRVRTDDQRRIPIEAERIIAGMRRWLNTHSLAGSLIEANQHPVLQLGVDCVRVFWIDLRAEAVPALCDEPV